MIWIPGKINYADADTKENRHFVETLQNMLFSCEITIAFKDAENRDSEQFFWIDYLFKRERVCNIR